MARPVGKRRWRVKPGSITPTLGIIWVNFVTASPASIATDLNKITEGLGSEWIFLETLYRIYSTAGYNIAHVDVTAKLCEEHDIRYQDIDRIEAVVNWLETSLSKPGVSGSGDRKSATGGIDAVFFGIRRGDSRLSAAARRPARPGETDPPEVLELMNRVTLIPMAHRTLFGPRVTIFTKDGRSFTREGTGREFIWDFEEEARRISPIVSGLAITPRQFDDLIDACRTLEQAATASRKLIQLTIPE